MYDTVFLVGIRRNAPSQSRPHPVAQILSVDGNRWRAPPPRRIWASLSAALGLSDRLARPGNVKETLTFKFKFTNKESQNLYLRHFESNK